MHVRMHVPTGRLHAPLPRSEQGRLFCTHSVPRFFNKKGTIQYSDLYIREFTIVYHVPFLSPTIRTCHSFSMPIELLLGRVGYYALSIEPRPIKCLVFAHTSFQAWELFEWSNRRKKESSLMLRTSTPGFSTRWAWDRGTTVSIREQH